MLQLAWKILSWLPLPVLYLGSFFVRIFLTYIIWYRDSVISNNLNQCFPDASPRERKQIQQKYLRHLSDLLVENVKTLTAGRRFFEKRIPFADLTLFDRLYAEKKNFIVVMGHLGNWEWSGLSMSLFGKHQLKALYRPIKSQEFNRFFRAFRSRFGAKMVPMKQVAREINQPGDRPYCLTFIADQTPDPEHAYWTQFLYRETPFFTGYEKIARRYRLPVVFVWIERKSRGHYLIHTEMLEDEPQNLPENALVEKFARKLEEKIRLQPAYWLWSHRRWKHIRK